MNHKFIKTITAVVTVFALLTACSSTDGKKETTEEPKKTEATEQTGSTSEAGNTNKETNKEQEAATNETAYPLDIEVTDAEGNKHTQTFDKAPERVITNNLSSIEILLQLGLKEKIVGITKPDNVVTGQFAGDVDSLEVIGDKMTVSKEIIAGHSPDIVVGRSMAFSDQSIGSVATLNDLGIKTYIQTASSMTTNPPLTNIIDDVLALGKIFNVNERAEAYAKELEERYQSVVNQANAKTSDQKLTLMPIVAYDAANSSFAIFNISGGLQADLLDKLNVAAAIEGSSADPSLETIISTNPDIILYVKADRNAALDEVAIDSIMNEPLLKDVSAIKEKRVYTTTYDDFMDYGVRIFDTFEMLGNHLYGQ